MAPSLASQARQGAQRLRANGANGAARNTLNSGLPRRTSLQTVSPAPRPSAASPHYVAEVVQAAAAPTALQPEALPPPAEMQQQAQAQAPAQQVVEPSVHAALLSHPHGGHDSTADEHDDAAVQPPPHKPLNAAAAEWVAPARPAPDSISASTSTSTSTSAVACCSRPPSPRVLSPPYAPAPASQSHYCVRDHNSVTIKSSTNVKDAAGAVVKVLSRLPSVFVTALRTEPTHDALNRAVKSVAVARKYVNDTEAGAEVSFVPFHRAGPDDAPDPSLFGLVCFKAPLTHGTVLLEHDTTDLNVSRSSSVHTMANAVIRILMERGQAVMKAGGSHAIFVALSALANARARLKRKHAMDAMVVPAWITEDTSSTLGRESKFLRLNVLPCPVGGPIEAAAALHAANVA